MPPAVRQMDKIDLMLTRLAETVRSGSPDLQQAIESLINAKNYRDVALIQSCVQTAYEALRKEVNDHIRNSLGYPKQFEAAWLAILEDAKGALIEPEEYGTIGIKLRDSLEQAEANLRALRDGSVRLMKEDDQPVPLEAELERDIEALRALKEKIFANWPWPDRPLPPVNRQMVEESRRAIKRGEGEPIEDLINRLTGNKPS